MEVISDGSDDDLDLFNVKLMDHTGATQDFLGRIHEMPAKCGWYPASAEKFWECEEVIGQLVGEYMNWKVAKAVAVASRIGSA